MQYLSGYDYTTVFIFLPKTTPSTLNFYLHANYQSGNYGFTTTPVQCSRTSGSGLKIQTLKYRESANPTGVLHCRPTLPATRTVSNKSAQIPQCRIGIKNRVHLRSYFFGKAARRIADRAAHHFDHRRRQRELVDSFFHVFRRQFVLNHELSHVADNLRGRGHLKKKLTPDRRGV